MRGALALLMTAIILVPLHASASTGLFWDHARYDSDGVQIEGGVIGYGTEWNVTSNNGTTQSFMSTVESLPTVVEVYTATWCVNCVSTQDTLNEAMSDLDTEIIHYHRYWFDSLDPFGSDSTEERWESKYGHASALRLTPRDAPTKVIEGERFHWGKVPKSQSLLDDYSASLSRGSTAPMTGNVSFTIHQIGDSLDVSWDISQLQVGTIDSQKLQIEPWLLMVEKSAYYPDGLNNLENYEHVLLDASILEKTSSHHGSSNLSIPNLWDGDDLRVIFLLDWFADSMEGTGSLLPAPGAILALTSIFAMAVVRPPKLA
tara:strand:+ start:353 stop:1300 length:948 start_codon:yes stop_codon:yes gene_type:complete